MTWKFSEPLIHSLPVTVTRLGVPLAENVRRRLSVTPVAVA